MEKTQIERVASPCPSHLCSSARAGDPFIFFSGQRKPPSPNRLASEKDHRTQLVGMSFPWLSLLCVQSCRRTSALKCARDGSLRLVLLFRGPFQPDVLTRCVCVFVFFIAHFGKLQRTQKVEHLTIRLFDVRCSTSPKIT